MNALVINCSPVRDGATAEIESCGKLGLCSVECKEDAAERIDEITGFCSMILDA